MKKIVIIILNYEGAEYISECIDSFKNSSFKNIKLIVVDNASKDNSNKIIGKIKGVKLIQNKTNLGYCEGFNRGIRCALKEYSPDYIIFSNNDLIVDKKAIEILVNSMEKDNPIGFAGPLILDYNSGKIQSNGGKWNKLTARFSTNQKKTPLKSKIFIEGTIFMMRANMLQLTHLFDPRYFLYHEDFAIQSYYRKQGFFSKIYPDSLAKHRSHNNKKRMPFQFYYMFRNRLLYVWENSNIFWFIYTGIILFIYAIFFGIFNKLLFKPTVYGLLDFFRKKFGKVEYKFNKLNG